LIQNVLASEMRHVVLTGGEPLLSPSIPRLCQSLRDLGLHLTIETAGTVESTAECDLLSLSPKLHSSTPDPNEHPMWSQLHAARRQPIEFMQRLMKQSREYQLKFVVTTPADWEEVQWIVNRLQASEQSVFIMPQGVTVSELDLAEVWLKPLCEQTGFQYCDRMQIRWYGNRRGT
jgi:7-carboxy-7-deazaguanine synthase